ncbi:S-adenosyl-L-methionine-dependent methyltransferase, partial [Aureobasidium melanogenum]|uniref:S-adenosyl-L-methionine-dependent methyltransferase n=1 Tax=Aureobasidium melanogenum (strain CBS 110374) TaxID=1043003 RepID=A0A074VSE2_AURM1
MLEGFLNRYNASMDLIESIQHALWYLLQCISSGNVLGAREHAFAIWYITLGHHFAIFEEKCTPVPRLVAQATGVTLELGPGSGNQLSRLDTRYVNKVYGIEPNVHFHKILKKKLSDMPDLGHKYTIVTAKLEDEQALREHDIEPGTVDTVLCMQVLCSVKDPAAAVKQIYRLLKPGGHFLYWEHCRSSDVTTRMLQRMWNIVWRPLIGGCSLTVRIDEAVQKTGPWVVKESGHDEDPHKLMPRSWAHLRKPEF